MIKVKTKLKFHTVLIMKTNGFLTICSYIFSYIEILAELMLFGVHVHVCVSSFLSLNT